MSQPAVVLVAVDRSSSMKLVPEQLQGVRDAVRAVPPTLTETDGFGLRFLPGRRLGDSGAAAPDWASVVELAAPHSLGETAVSDWFPELDD